MVGDRSHEPAGRSAERYVRPTERIFARAVRQSISIRQFRAFVVCVNIERAAAYLTARRISSHFGIHPKRAFLFASQIIFT
jgi:hypothetical protein